MGTTTTLVSVSSPVTVTAGQFVVVKGVVCSTVMDRTADCVMVVVVVDVVSSVGFSTKTVVVVVDVVNSVGSSIMTVVVVVDVVSSVGLSTVTVVVVTFGATDVPGSVTVTVLVRGATVPGVKKPADAVVAGTKGVDWAWIVAVMVLRTPAVELLVSLA